MHTYIHIHMLTYIQAYIHAYIRTAWQTYIQREIDAYINTYIKGNAYLHTARQGDIQTQGQAAKHDADIHTCIHTYIQTKIHTHIQANRYT